PAVAVTLILSEPLPINEPKRFTTGTDAVTVMVGKFGVPPVVPTTGVIVAVLVEINLPSQ
ncbi:hypothetical protein, partial [Escherichia coli]|uniref:hypothetical protein n=1 Tax=Escherichia coli TaxID=562 RepID=UPI002361CB27